MALTGALELVASDEVALQIELVVACAATENLLGRHADAYARLVAARAAVDDPRSRASVLLELELSAYGTFANDAELARDAARRARESAEMLSDAPLQAAAAALTCFAEYTAGDHASSEEARVVAKALVDGLDPAAAGTRVDTFFYLGWSEWFLGRYADAEAHFARGIAVSHATARTHLLVELTVARAIALTWLGRLEEATELGEESVEAARLSSNPLRLMWSQIALCLARTGTGDLEAAVRAGEEATSIALSINVSVIAAAAGWTTAAALIEAGEAEHGTKVMLDMLGGPELPGYFLAMRPTCYDLLARAALASDRLSEAREWARRATDVAAEVGLTAARAAADRANAAVLLAEGDPAAAAELALSSAAASTFVGARVDSGRAKLLAGRALAAAGDRERAGAQLRAAEAELSECGAQRLSSEAIRELRRIGLKVHRGGRRGELTAGGLASLSGREREVAELVMARKTNRQIATGLFLSEKTVESHLSSVFFKLGVRSRAEVARELERAAAAGG
jgi:DNA-binding CsgD family transcriptional regulator/tetratricopeptide (TPR) repeat protein